MDKLKANVKLGERVFLAPNATVVGNATLADDCSVWFGAVLRADGDSITVGERTNIQDNAVVHVDPGFPVSIGHDCIIGHLALVHGATIGNYVLVGMHSTVLNGAEVGDYSIIGANALVTAGTKIPPYSLVMGVPAKVVKTIGPEQVAQIKRNAEVYVTLKDKYLSGDF